MCNNFENAGQHLLGTFACLSNFLVTLTSGWLFILHR